MMASVTEEFHPFVNKTDQVLPPSKLTIMQGIPSAYSDQQTVENNTALAFVNEPPVERFSQEHLCYFRTRTPFELDLMISIQVHHHLIQTFIHCMSTINTILEEAIRTIKKKVGGEVRLCLNISSLCEKGSYFFWVVAIGVRTNTSHWAAAAGVS